MQTLTDQIKSHRGPPRWLAARAHDVGEEAERDRLVQPGEETAQGDLTAVYNYLMGEHKEGEVHLFSEVDSEETQGNRHKTEQGKF